jgi:DNA-binding transcriptional MocR family regulator
MTAEAMVGADRRAQALGVPSERLMEHAGTATAAAARALAIDTERWARRCLDRGVFWHTGRRYAFDQRPIPFARFSFARLNERELQEAIKRMAAVLPRSRGGLVYSAGK